MGCGGRLGGRFFVRTLMTLRAAGCGFTGQKRWGTEAAVVPRP